MFTQSVIIAQFGEKWRSYFIFHCIFIIYLVYRHALSIYTFRQRSLPIEYPMGLQWWQEYPPTYGRLLGVLSIREQRCENSNVVIYSRHITRANIKNKRSSTLRKPGPRSGPRRGFYTVLWYLLMMGCDGYRNLTWIILFGNRPHLMAWYCTVLW